MPGQLILKWCSYCLEHIILIHCLIFLVINVTFHNATYTVNEDVGIIRPLLVLSNPSSFDETVQVNNTDITTNGIVYHAYVGNWYYMLVFNRRCGL